MRRREINSTRGQCCCDQRHPVQSNYCLRQFFPTNQYHTERIAFSTINCQPMETKIRGRAKNMECDAEKFECNRKRLLISCPKKVNTFKDPLARCENCRQNSDCQGGEDNDCQRLQAKPYYPSLEEYIQNIQFLSMSNCLY